MHADVKEYPYTLVINFTSSSDKKYTDCKGHEVSFWYSGVRWWCKQILLLKLVQFASYIVIKILNDVYVHLYLNKFWFILLEVESLWMKI